MCLNKILQQANSFRNEVAYLKTIAPIYPNIYYLEDGRTLWATSMVEFEYEGIKYRRHHVNSIRLDLGDGVKVEDLARMLNNNAEMCIKFGKPMQLSNIVDIDGKFIMDDVVTDKT